MELGLGFSNVQYTFARCVLNIIKLATFEAFQSVRSGGVKFDPTIRCGLGAFLAMLNIRLQGAL